MNKWQKNIIKLRRKVKNKYKNSYTISMFLDGCMSIPMQDIIAETVEKLPRKVIDFVFEKCTFISEEPGMLSGHTLNKKDIKSFLIILIGYNSYPNKRQKFRYKCTIAHEIAHAYLGHRGFYGGKEAVEMEKEAWKLATKWRFWPHHRL